MAQDNWRNEFLEDHGDPGPEDWEIEAEEHNERMRHEPTLSPAERNRRL